MTTGRKTKRTTKKPMLKKETIKNLDVKAKGSKVKGGQACLPSERRSIGCTGFGAC